VSLSCVVSVAWPRVWYCLMAWHLCQGASVAEWLACWTQAQKGPSSNRAATLSGDSLRQTVRTHRASVHQAAKLVAALLRVAGQLQAWRKVMAAYCQVYDSRHLQADCQEPGSAPEPYARQSSMGYHYLFYLYQTSLKTLSRRHYLALRILLIL